MARALSRREIYMIGGLGLAAAVWMWHSWGGGAAPGADLGAGPEGAKSTFKVGEAPTVHMEHLDRSVVKYDDGGRDLFKYSPRPPSVAEVNRMKAEARAAAEAQRKAEEAARLAAEQKAKEDAVRAEQARLHPPPPPEPTPPPVMFQFMGFVGPPSDRVAAFEQNNETFVAKTGEVIRKDFKLEEIRYESVLISYVNPQFKGKTRELPLSRGASH